MDLLDRVFRGRGQPLPQPIVKQETPRGVDDYIFLRESQWRNDEDKYGSGKKSIFPSKGYLEEGGIRKGYVDRSFSRALDSPPPEAFGLVSPPEPSWSDNWMNNPFILPGQESLFEEATPRAWQELVPGYTPKPSGGRQEPQSVTGAQQPLSAPFEAVESLDLHEGQQQPPTGGGRENQSTSRTSNSSNEPPPGTSEPAHTQRSSEAPDTQRSGQVLQTNRSAATPSVQDFNHDYKTVQNTPALFPLSHPPQPGSSFPQQAQEPATGAAPLLSSPPPGGVPPSDPSLASESPAPQAAPVPPTLTGPPPGGVPPSASPSPAPTHRPGDSPTVVEPPATPATPSGGAGKLPRPPSSGISSKISAAIAALTKGQEQPGSGAPSPKSGAPTPKGARPTSEVLGGGKKQVLEEAPTPEDSPNLSSSQPQAAPPPLGGGAGARKMAMMMEEPESREVSPQLASAQAQGAPPPFPEKEQDSPNSEDGSSPRQSFQKSALFFKNAAAQAAPSPTHSTQQTLNTATQSTLNTVSLGSYQQEKPPPAEGPPAKRIELATVEPEEGFRKLTPAEQRLHKVPPELKPQLEESRDELAKSAPVQRAADKVKQAHVRTSSAPVQRAADKVKQEKVGKRVELDIVGYEEYLAERTSADEKADREAERLRAFEEARRVRLFDAAAQPARRVQVIPEETNRIELMHAQHEWEEDWRDWAPAARGLRTREDGKVELKPLEPDIAGGFGDAPPTPDWAQSQIAHEYSPAPVQPLLMPSVADPAPPDAFTHDYSMAPPEMLRMMADSVKEGGRVNLTKMRDRGGLVKMAIQTARAEKWRSVADMHQSTDFHGRHADMEHEFQVLMARVNKTKVPVRPKFTPKSKYPGRPDLPYERPRPVDYCTPQGVQMGYANERPPRSVKSGAQDEPPIADAISESRGMPLEARQRPQDLYGPSQGLHEEGQWHLAERIRDDETESLASYISIPVEQPPPPKTVWDFPDPAEESFDIPMYSPPAPPRAPSSSGVGSVPMDARSGAGSGPMDARLALDEWANANSEKGSDTLLRPDGLPVNIAHLENVLCKIKLVSGVLLTKDLNPNPGGNLLYLIATVSLPANPKFPEVLSVDAYEQASKRGSTARTIDEAMRDPAYTMTVEKRIKDVSRVFTEDGVRISRLRILKDQIPPGMTSAQRLALNNRYPAYIQSAPQIL